VLFYDSKDFNLIYVVLFTGIAIAISLFLASFFLFIKGKGKLENRLLGLFFAAIAFCLTDTLIYFLFQDILRLGLVFGYLALASIGPLVYLYITHFSVASIQLKKSDFSHFIIPVFGALACSFLNYNNIEIIYRAATMLLCVYVAFSYINYLKHKTANQSVKKWNKHLLYITSIIAVALLYQYFNYQVNDYAISGAIVSASIYYAFFIALKYPIQFRQSSVIKLPNVTIEKIKRAFEVDKIYKKNGINLIQFSNEQDIPPYLITKAVKKIYHKTFPETVNYFRIQEVKKLLTDSENSNIAKIEVIAYEVGFGSPSVFYKEFKKVTGTSPKKYKDTLPLKKMVQ